MYYYCSAPGCGNRIEYQVSKPTSCPKCKTVFADLGKTIAKAKPLPEVMSIKAFRRRELEAELENLDEKGEEDADDNQTLSNQISASKKAILKRARARKLAERGETDEVDDEANDDTVEDEDDQEDSPRSSKVKRLAQEMIASIDPSSIKVIGGDEDDGPNKITFRKWCGEKE